MKALYSAALAAALTTFVAPTALAGTSTDDAVGMCKEQATAEFSHEGTSTRLKFRGTSGKYAATQVRLQVYPKGEDSFKATCSVNRKTGEILSLARDDAPDNNLLQTAER